MSEAQADALDDGVSSSEKTWTRLSAIAESCVGSVTVVSDGHSVAMSAVSVSATASQAVASAQPCSSSSVDPSPASCQASGGK